MPVVIVTTIIAIIVDQSLELFIANAFKRKTVNLDHSWTEKVLRLTHSDLWWDKNSTKVDSTLQSYNS